MSNGATTRSNGTNTNGWVRFAGIMMIVAGFFQSIFGLVAILKPSVLIATENNLVLFDYTRWGWIHLAVGAILIVSASSLFAGRLWGRILAVALAILSAILNFGSIWAYPIWSILIIAIDIMVIYSVAMYGGRSEDRVG